MCVMLLRALLLSQLTLFYGNPLFLSSIYMHKGGKRKLNYLKYAQINKAKPMIYRSSNELNGMKTFFWSVDQINLW